MTKVTIIINPSSKYQKKLKRLKIVLKLKKQCSGQDDITSTSILQALIDKRPHDLIIQTIREQAMDPESRAGIEGIIGKEIIDLILSS